MKPEAIILDMDGTLLDNNPYHLQAWQAFYNKRGRELSLEDYKQNINGKRAKDSFRYVFQRELTPGEVELFAGEKEALYRQLYEPHIKPIDGLISFLEEVKAAGIPLSIATSGIPVNIDFMFKHIRIKQYFSAVIDATQISKGKPDPEIFIKAALAVNADPAKCIAFEDSIAGIQSAKSAGMLVVALTTMQKKESLYNADLVIDNYTQVSVGLLQSLGRH